MTKQLHRHNCDFSFDDKYIYKSADYRVYRSAILLTPGAWSDSVTRAPVVYTESALSRFAENWTENWLDLDHSWNTLDRIGTIQNPMFFNGAVRGDLFVSPMTSRGADTIALIDAGLVNHLSVELLAEDVWNQDEQVRYADDIEFLGAAVCTHPADANTRIIPDV